MENDDLRDLLQQLHDEIHNTQTVDEEGSELLRDLERDITALLERSGENPVQVQLTIVVARLESALRHFEVTHPGLTAAISRLLDSLSNAGI
jgi:hypothetical protein